jgi:peptidoglycan/xylan/chitin deacetylase (PgdA/CDA1 family)
MKNRLLRHLSCIALALTVLVPFANAHVYASLVPMGNLIANPSVENAASNGNVPLNWQNNSWGDLTADFQYITSNGQSGRKSLSLVVTNYTSGDAKWFFDPIAIIPNLTMVYSDYYLSSAKSEVVIQYQMTDGTYVYKELGTLAASKTWKMAGFQFTTPANVAKMTVFHLLRSNGTLQTDTFSLKAPTSPIVTDTVPNASVEQVNDLNESLPLAWSRAGWGTNTTKYTYPKTGYDGSRSVRVDITNYSSGDAKWVYDAQPILANQYYRFRDYYKSNVSTEVVAAVGLSDGTTQYVDLGTVPASTSWAPIGLGFTSPATAKTLTVFHLLAHVGYLVTDKYSVVAMEGPVFRRPIVSLTFDDGWESNYMTVFPLLKQYGMTSNQYIVTNFIGTTGYMTASQVQEMSAAGNEIGSHTQSHSDLTTLTSAKVNTELKQSQWVLSTLLGKPVTSFAIPYDSYNANVMTAIKKYYASSRTSDVGFNTLDTLNRYAILTQNVDVTTTSEQVKSWIDTAIQTKSWLVLLYHQVDTSGSDYSTTPAQFEENLKYLQSTGVSVQTVSQALQELAPQF